jgi:MYXO-CTERM domain-containing protein
MKKIFAITALVIFSSTLAFAQNAPPARDTDNTATTTRYDEPRHNLSWLGLLGLVGLVGLRRQKSETAQRFEARGVKVGTV